MEIIETYEQTTAEQRENLVVKANELIQNSRFNLSAQQQKILLYIISLIKPNDKEFTMHKISINEFCKVCGLDKNNGKNYIDIKRQIKGIADNTSFWIKTTPTRETLLRLIERVDIEQQSGIIEIRLNNDLKPYLLDIKSRFTAYELYNVLLLKSSYSIRAYEYFQSVHFDKLKPYKFIVTIEEFKNRVGAAYKDYKHLNERVIQQILKEINEKTDKNLSIKPLKEIGSKSYTNLEIIISPKETGERFKIRAEIEKKLNKDEQKQNIKGQINLFDSIDWKE